MSVNKSLFPENNRLLMKNTKLFLEIIRLLFPENRLPITPRPSSQKEGSLLVEVLLTGGGGNPHVRTYAQ